MLTFLLPFLRPQNPKIKTQGELGSERGLPGSPSERPQYGGRMGGGLLYKFAVTTSDSALVCHGCLRGKLSVLLPAFSFKKKTYCGQMKIFCQRYVREEML
jgi:hypothetical protein